VAAHIVEDEKSGSFAAPAAGGNSGALSDAGFPPARIGWTAVSIIFLLMIVSVLDRNILTLLIGSIQEDLHLDDVEAGLLLGLAFALPYGLMALPVGSAVDRFQRRHIIFIGVSLWSFATLCTGFARSFEALFAARAGVGAGEASLSPSQQSLLSDLFPREKLALPLSVSSMGLKVGQGAALMIGGALTLLFLPMGYFDVPLIGTMRGWEVIFVIIGLPGLLLAFAIYLIPEPRRHSPMAESDTASHGFVQYFQLMKRNKFFYTYHHVGQLLSVAFSTAVTSWAPAYFARVFDWSPSTTGLWLGTALLAGPILGLPLHGYIVDRFYRRGSVDFHMRYMSILILVGAPFGIAAFLIADPFVSAILIGLFFFIITGYTSIPIVAVQILLPSRMRGKGSSIMALFAGTGGTILGPLLVGTLTDHVFQDRDMVGASIAICLIVIIPAVSACYWASMKHLRNFRLSD
jgi:MFS family permease